MPLCMCCIMCAPSSAASSSSSVPHCAARRESLMTAAVRSTFAEPRALFVSSTSRRRSSIVLAGYYSFSIIFSQFMSPSGPRRALLGISARIIDESVPGHDVEASRRRYSNGEGGSAEGPARPTEGDAHPNRGISRRLSTSARRPARAQVDKNPQQYKTKR